MPPGSAFVGPGWLFSSSTSCLILALGQGPLVFLCCLCLPSHANLGASFSHPTLLTQPETCLHLCKKKSTAQCYRPPLRWAAELGPVTLGGGRM